jgi:hypothetical protein
MIEKLNKVTSQKSLYNAAIGELLQQVSEDFLTLVSGIVKEVTKIDVEDIIKRKKGLFKRIKDNTKLHVKDIDALIPLKHTLQKIRKNLKQLSEKFHIILIVDELDRCLPEYAIKVLERLHHVCDEIPIIQILAINKSVLTDSISTVFGKDYSKTDSHDKWNTFFTDSYLQKFLDISIPLPNGTLNSSLEILNGLEKNYVPYIRPTNFGQEFIKLDEEFLILFITTLMDGVERRLQEKIFKQVELCHKLTIDSGINLNQERCTYAILIYEIISCICRYVFHLSETCKILEGNENYSLVFSHVYLSSSKVTKVKYDKFNENLKNFLVSEIRNVPYVYQKYPFEIIDTKTYIMAYFGDSTKRSIDTLQNYLFDRIFEDKIFLQKYDEIMNIIIGK